MARNHPQVMKPGQRRDDVGRDAVAEKSLFGVAAQVRERQYRDRRHLVARPCFAVAKTGLHQAVDDVPVDRIVREMMIIAGILKPLVQGFRFR